tara:strand:- start:487 stop:705 length:219 start_codon:yes stop_codon:yes gene_type:complete
MFKDRLKIIYFFLMYFYLLSAKAGNYFKFGRLLFDLYGSQWVNMTNGIITNINISFSFSSGKNIPMKSSNFS